MSELERRLTRHAVELRASAGAEPRIGGYAAKFNTLSQNLGGFVERIAAGFFDSSRDNHWRGVMARYNHELLLGSVAGESLRLAIDSTGLDYEVDLLDDPSSQRVLKLVNRGDVAKSSFAFITTEDEWSMTEAGFPLRTLVRGELVDVAPVDSPAYMDTSTGLRALAEARSMDLAEVQLLASEERLSEILKVSPVVIDLGSDQTERSDPSDSAGRVQVLRRALDMKKAV